MALGVRSPAFVEAVVAVAVADDHVERPTDK